MLISEPYRQLNARLHVDRDAYGITGRKFAATISGLARSIEAAEILDYGCGKQTLRDAIDGAFPVRGYDPAIPGLDAAPEPADMVACTDVLEHIEPDCLDAVLDDLLRVTRKVLFATVATRPAEKVLADGRNAHLIVESYAWWLPRLWQRFEMHGFQRLGKAEFAFVGVPKAACGSGCGHAH